MLESILVCPVCKNSLPLDEIRRLGKDQCAQCGRTFQFREGVFDLIPNPPPDQAQAKDTWALWEKLQQNGLLSYTSAPELNLSKGARKDSHAFGAFCNLKGRVLDVGCGPQKFPTYATGFTGELVGVDPLLGDQPRDFHFVQAIGEYLPFRNETFDHVVLSSCLDHMPDPVRALKEVRRVIKPQGNISIWVDCADHEGFLLMWRRRLMKMLNLGLTDGLSALAGNLWGSVQLLLNRKFTRPVGAVDHFHFCCMNQDILKSQLTQANLELSNVTRNPIASGFFALARPA